MADAIQIDEVREGNNVLNLNRSRQKAIYYRKVGEEWVATTPLPADPQSIAMYFAKGFRAKPPTDKVEKVEGAITCPVCGFSAANVMGLMSHLRIHRKEEKPE